MNVYTPIFQENVRNTPLELDSLSDQQGALTLALSGTNDYRLVMRFDSHVAYRKLDEGDALLTLSAMRSSGGTGKYLYEVNDSDFLVWFNSERCGQRVGERLVHYVIAAANDIVDVLSIDPPNFTPSVALA